MTELLFGLSGDDDFQIKDGRIVGQEASEPQPSDGEEAGPAHQSHVLQALAGEQGNGTGTHDDIDVESFQTAEPLLTGPSESSQTDEEKETGKLGRLIKIEPFWDHLAAGGKGKRTIEEYRYQWAWWKRQAKSLKRTPYTLRARDIEFALKDLHPATVRKKLAFLRVLGLWYLREGFSALHTERSKVQAPRLPERLPRDKGAKQFVSLREKARLWCEEGKREGIWVGLMLMCGLRISEIQTATLEGEGKIRVLGKGLKERIVPASAWILDAMAEIQREGRGGWVQGRKTIWKCLAQQGIKNPHSLRHTYASELTRRKKPIEEIRVLLGHKKIETTSIYAHLEVPLDAADLLDKE